MLLLVASLPPSDNSTLPSARSNRSGARARSTSCNSRSQDPRLCAGPTGCCQRGRQRHRGDLPPPHSSACATDDSTSGSPMRGLRRPERRSLGAATTRRRAASCVTDQPGRGGYHRLPRALVGLSRAPKRLEAHSSLDSSRTPRKLHTWSSTSSGTPLSSVTGPAASPRRAAAAVVAGWRCSTATGGGAPEAALGPQPICAHPARTALYMLLLRSRSSTARQRVGTYSGRGAAARRVHARRPKRSPTAHAMDICCASRPIGRQLDPWLDLPRPIPGQGSRCAAGAEEAPAPPPARA